MMHMCNVCTYDFSTRRGIFLFALDDQAKENKMSEKGKYLRIAEGKKHHKKVHNDSSYNLYRIKIYYLWQCVIKYFALAWKMRKRAQKHNGWKWIYRNFIWTNSYVLCSRIVWCHCEWPFFFQCTNFIFMDFLINKLCSFFSLNYHDWAKFM